MVCFWKPSALDALKKSAEDGKRSSSTGGGSWPRCTSISPSAVRRQLRNKKIPGEAFTEEHKSLSRLVCRRPQGKVVVKSLPRTSSLGGVVVELLDNSSQSNSLLSIDM